MKKIIALTFVLVTAGAGYSLAQMGHGMMRGGHMMKEMHQQENRGDDSVTRKQQPSHETPPHHRQFLNGIIGAAQDMAIMMRQMSVIMGNITETDKIKSGQDMQRISSIMKDMAAEMNSMAAMAGKGTATAGEVRAMQERILALEDQLWEMRRD